MKSLPLEHVPALVTPLHVVLVVKVAKLPMVTVSVEQTVISMGTVALMSTVLHVNENALFFIFIMIIIMSFNTDPRTCQDIGITSCCTDNTGTGLCDVHFRDPQNNRCSCNVTCHLRNDCCTDAASFCVRK